MCVQPVANRGERALTCGCGIGRGVQIPTVEPIRVLVSSLDAARATTSVRDEDDEPGDDRQADHDLDPDLPGPTPAPLHTDPVIDAGPPRH